MSTFSDPDTISSYAEMAERNVPALRDLHRMVSLLLAEKVPADGRILVLGAGGGLELRAMARQNPDWRFDGVDPSPQMLDQARAVTHEFTDRITLHEGYIEDGPEGPFDGATCLLTLHFLSQEERVRTLRDICRRLHTGAPLVIVHHSFENDDAGKDKWLSRFATYIATSEMGDAGNGINVEAMKERLPVLSPEQDVSTLLEAGFSQVELFYAALTFRGWVAYRT
ncbi:class I SAM-dependent methyltransferase [Thalassospira sp.]|uniref:class I SAM-dependent methyltransferase n=1 Tax=Thalassospira sp. TaxID=1912094 RepID=UPI002736B03A|nr:class I SAM-dependent methyltransferase [Thalassospira sp.]MDP2699771.1 methyltransferase domain-containing protein [Thalassospira sp.]